MTYMYAVKKEPENINLGLTGQAWIFSFCF